MEERVEYVVISGGIKVRIDKPKSEAGTKREQLQAKLDYHNMKTDFYKSELRKIAYAEQSAKNIYLKQTTLFF